MILNATNSKAISEACGSTKVETWAGQRIAIYTQKVTAFGGTTDALRIRNYPPRETKAFCDNCGCEIETHGSYSVNKIGTMSKAKYGQALCWECAQARKEADK